MIGMHASAARGAFQPLLYRLREYSCREARQFPSAILDDRPVRLIPSGLARLLLMARALPLAITALDFQPQPLDELGSNAVRVSAQFLFDFVECVPLPRQRPHNTSKSFAALSLGSTVSDQLNDVIETIAARVLLAGWVVVLCDDVVYQGVDIDELVATALLYAADGDVARSFPVDFDARAFTASNGEPAMRLCPFGGADDAQACA